MNPEATKEQVIDLMKTINRAWYEGNPGLLYNYFHKNMMIVTQDMKILGNGRDACIMSYMDFTKNTKIHNYKDYNYEVAIWGNTALVSYKFDISYEMKRMTYDETGKDIFFFTFEEDKWQAVWRMLVEC